MVRNIAKNTDISNGTTENETGEISKESESKDKPLYVKVSDETRDTIDRYKNEGITISNLIKDAIKLYDDFHSASAEVLAIINKYKDPDETMVNFIERALKFYGDQKETDRDLWIRAREEMKMMLIGKTTFNQLIAAAESPKDSLEEPFKKNVAIDLLLWYTGKPLKLLTVEEIITTIQKIWVVANYFYMIDVKRFQMMNFTSFLNTGRINGTRTTGLVILKPYLKLKKWHLSASLKVKHSMKPYQ